MKNRDELKEKLMNDEVRYRGPNKIIIFMFVFIAIVGIGAFVINAKKDSVPIKRYSGGNYNIGKSMNYKGKEINMTDISNNVENGKVILDLSQVIKHRIVYTEYQNKKLKKTVPLAVFITPSGRIVVVISMCEPCRSQRFRIRDNILVCETCGTRWFLNDLRGISGGCVNYPPEEIPYKVDNGKVYIDENIVKNWTLRI
ncbi:Fe-S-containing protein [Deferribacter abyssi]|uniref:Fe-S-containing protein n=1 Tax=Deferribacter abyssi TaxID=213806 RepID=UPI003C20416B